MKLFITLDLKGACQFLKHKEVILINILVGLIYIIYSTLIIQTKFKVLINSFVNIADKVPSRQGTKLLL